MNRFIITGFAAAAFGLATIAPATAENLFAPLNDVYDVDSKTNKFGIRRQGVGRMNTNLLHDIFNRDRRSVSQVPLQMLDGSQSTLQLRHQQSNNLDGIQIVSGIVDGKSHNMATLVNDNGEIRGRIWKDGKLLRLDGDRNGEYKLSSINVTHMPEKNDTIRMGWSESERTSNKQRGEAQKALPPEGEPIDLLLLITERTAKELGGVKKAMPEMKLMIAETNNIYRQSGVTNGMMFRTVGIMILPLKEHNDIGRDLEAWRSIKPVLALRNRLGADLVAFITSPDNHDGYCGRGFLGPDVANPEVFPELGYSISVLSCTLTDLVFPHELGHNMGAWHDRHVDPRKGNNHGHINLEKNWRTVMAYPSYCWQKLKKKCPSVPYFSNPNLFYESDVLGVAAGQSNSADNVAAIKRNKRIVASYRPRADAGASNSGTKTSTTTPTTSARRQIGGIILEPSVRQNSAKRAGKERKIKW